MRIKWELSVNYFYFSDVVVGVYIDGELGGLAEEYGRPFLFSLQCI